MTTPIQGEANRLIDSPGLAAAVERLVEFLAGGSFTSGISRLEQELAGATTETLVGAIGSSGITQDLLAASILVRRNFGRISDVIHASAIVLTLPQVLEDGETLMRPPSLAAGNDPSRPYDLETDRRVAEFKLSEWKGPDAARKRQVFKDLVHLAADQSERRRQLYVVGQAPIKFLRGSKSAAGWGLDRFPATQQLFENRFGPLTMCIRDFTATSDVELIDLIKLLPMLEPIVMGPKASEDVASEEPAARDIPGGAEAENVPAWALLRSCAEELGAGGQQFQLAALIRRAQERDPSRPRSSLQPIVQGMTVNAPGGADPGEARDLLERVAHGVYRLRGASGTPKP